MPSALERAKADAVSFIRVNGRLPAQVWIGSQTLTLADFAATLAGDDGVSPSISWRKGNAEMERYIATDPAGPYGPRRSNWKDLLVDKKYQLIDGVIERAAQSQVIEMLQSVKITAEQAIVDLCSCFGEPMDRVQSDEPELIAYVRAHPDHRSV